METLNEGSLSRVLKHNREYECAALSAMREAANCGKGKRYTHKDNQKRNKSLKAKLMREGYGVISIMGNFPENQEEDPAKKQERLDAMSPEEREAELEAEREKKFEKKPTPKVIIKSPKEASYFVVNKNNDPNFRETIAYLGEMFEQDSVLIVPKGAIANEGEKAYLLGTSHCSGIWLKYGQKNEFDKGKLGKINPNYTSYIGKRPFIFESLKENHLPHTGFGRWMLNIVADMDWEDIDLNIIQG